MARKPWAQLSPNHRARLEKNGITPEMHAAGASLKAARGHAQTPEHPGQFNPQQFPKYAAERQRLNALMQAKKEQVFGASPRWAKGGAQRSLKYLRERPPAIGNLRWAVYKASDEELFDAIREDPKTFSFLGY